MDLTKDLINDIEQFLNDEEIMNFFEIKGFKPTFKPILGKYNIVCLENPKKKTKNIEIMDIKKDRKNKNRIRFKGNTWAFSIKLNNNGKFYLDHLLIGNVIKDEYTFIMRQNIDENNNTEFIIKLVDNNNIKHIYHIKDDCIHITRQTIIPKEFECKNNRFIEKQSNNNKIMEEFLYFKGKDNNPTLLDYSKKNQDACKQEFLILESSYISITSFISKRIPFLTACITEKTDDKPYKIERKKKISEPYKKNSITINKHKIYELVKK